MKAKHQRLVLLLLAMVAIGGAALLAMSGLRDQASYFYAPADLLRRPPEPGKAVRLGGMVEAGSLKQLPDGVTIRFTVADGVHKVPVTYSGIAPDLFREGSGAVAEGRFRADGSFEADTILAKHDERYMPPQAAGAKHKSESLR